MIEEYHHETSLITTTGKDHSQGQIKDLEALHLLKIIIRAKDTDQEKSIITIQEEAEVREDMVGLQAQDQ